MASTSAPDKQFPVAESLRTSYAATQKRKEPNQPAGPKSDPQTSAQSKRRRLKYRRRVKAGASIADEVERIAAEEDRVYDFRTLLELGNDLPAVPATQGSRVKRLSVNDRYYSEAPTVSGLQHALAKANEKITRLRADLEEEQQWNTQVEARVKQDMFLDVIRERDLRQRAENNLERERRIHHEKVLEMEEALEKSNSNALQAQENTTHAIELQKRWQAEAEHLEALTATLEGDLDELRDIENEQAVKRSNENRGLPPAYGNLDDEDLFPPYSRHEDAGSLEVAHLKRKARESFGITINTLLRTGDRGILFLRLTQALANACQNFQAHLDLAPSITVSRSHRKAKLSIPPGMNGKEFMVSSQSGHAITESTHDKLLIQKPAGAPYVASRIARLIHDLGWRFLSVCDHGLRLPTPGLDIQSELTLKYQEIDSVLMSALQLAFRDKRPLPKLKFYLTKTMVLREYFLDVQQGLSLPYFNRSIAWLEEQVESARELAANAPIEINKRSREDAVDSDDQSVNASSRWQSESEADDEDDEAGADDGGEDEFEDNEDQDGGANEDQDDYDHNHDHEDNDDDDDDDVIL